MTNRTDHIPEIGKERSNRLGRGRSLLVAIAFLLSGPLWLAASAQVSLTIDKTHNAPTPVPSGQVFTYTIAYSWSGGVPGTILIDDVVPPELDVISTIPAASVSGNNVQFALTGLTGTAGAGTVQINVRFKPGVTCPDTRACNVATISREGVADSDVTSEEACAIATATNKWTIEKTLFAGCALDNEVIFRICIKNPSGGNIGGLNLNDVVLTDILPANATVTSVTGSWSGFTQTGTTVSLTGGPSTLPVSPYNAWYCVYIKVNFPSANFTAGQTVLNTGRISFRTPCDDPQGRPTTWTDTASVTLCDANPSGNVWKGLSLNLYFPSNPFYLPTFTPGCCGTYRVYYANNGNVGQPNVKLVDDLPPEVDLNSIRTQVPTGMTACTLKVYCSTSGVCGTTACTTVVYTTPGTYTLSTVPANACKVEWQYGGTMPIATSLNSYLDVCVRTNSLASPFGPVTAGDTIKNTFTAQADNFGPVSTTHTKIVDGQTPKILATKLFMGECTSSCTPNTAGPFVPGDIVRWRMAVANVGNVNATTATITDNLPSGLSYVGNETYFYGAYNWLANAYNPNCCSLTTTVPTQIGGTITTPSLGDTALTWSFPVLPARCDGTVEYFIIEFDVKISDAPPALPGNYPNTFTFGAGNLGSPVTSNVATLTVNAISQLQLAKSVRPAGSSGPFLTSAGVPQGGQAEFRLALTNTGNMALADICLLDIMPHVGDIRVLPGYAARNSQFDLPTSGAAISLTPSTGYLPRYNTSTNTKNPRRSTECGGFCGVADPTTGFGTLTTGVFGGTPATTHSFKVTANPSITLAPGDSLVAIVTGQVPGSAMIGDTACNSFAVQATPAGTNTCLKAEAAPACVRVTDQQHEDPCREIWLGGKPNDCCEYRFGISNHLGGLMNLQYNVLSGGTVQSVSSFPCNPTSTTPASLAGTTSGTLTFDPNCTQSGPQQIGIAANPTSDTVCIELIAVIFDPRTQKEFICRDTICFVCEEDGMPIEQCDSMTVKPFPFHQLDLSGRTFKIFNVKIPPSPICSVKVNVAPPPSGPGVNGGGLYIDGTWQSWPWGSSNGYTEILPVHGMPASNTVQFNLGIDYTIGWVGNVIVTSYHCDGDSCVTRYGPWKAEKGKPVVGTGGVITGPKLFDSAHFYTLQIDPKEAPQGTRYLSIDHGDEEIEILGVTPASPGCDSASVADGTCDDRITLVESERGTALISLRRSSDETGANDRPVDLAVFLTATGEVRKTITITFYDIDGNELGTAEVEVTTSSLTSDVPDATTAVSLPTGFTVQPNPTATEARADFRLQRSEPSVTIELVDGIGRHVETLRDAAPMSAGDHTIALDLRSLPNGSYYILLQTATGSQSRRIVVQR